MRNLLYVCLAVLLVVPSLARVGVTKASNTSLARGETVSQATIEPTGITGLPNYDIRRERGENNAGSFSASSLASGAAKGRADSVERFRAGLAPALRDNLHVEFNEAGVPKSFFNYDAPLSAAQAGSHDSVARDFLAANTGIFGLTAGDVRALKLENVDNDGGISFLNYEQTINGITVFHGHVQVAVNAAGEVLSVNEGMLIPDGKVKTRTKVSEARALRKALQYAGREGVASPVVLEPRAEIGDRSVFANPLGAGYDNIISDLRVIHVGDKAVAAWHSYVDVGPSEWYEILVDANSGDLLFRYNLYADVAQGTVFTESPTAGARSLVSFVGDTVINTSAGWMGTSTVTTGNNVEAYLDTDANNTPDPNNTTGLSNGHASSSTQDFTFPFATGVDPRTEQPAVVSNLFYFINIAHDYTYRLGFTESAGNFQTNNFGRGGTGNDSVRGEAQDGSGTNNANFSTPPDGSRPRMQQFLFTLGTTALTDDRDSSQDGDVVLHEFGHGVSNRLVGGPANTSCLGGTQAGAMGEGWSDYWACSFFNDGRVGEYVANNTTRGIRRAAYSVPADPVHDSYADLGVGGFEVHRDGEVWAATLWDLRDSLGAALVDRIVLEGMKFTPCSPSFLDARNGILQADQNLNGGANKCAIWTVFARHGMGNSATGNNGTTHNAATDLPPDCAGGGGGGATVVFSDDFETSLGWVRNPNGTDTATTGQWERANPEDTNSSGAKQLGTTTSGVNDLVTGALAGASAGENDIDGGTTSARSPAITLPATGTLTLSFNSYLAHGSNATSADFLRVSIVSGSTTTTVFQKLGAAVNVNGAWVLTTVDISAFAGQTVNIQIEAADAGTASLVEAGVDDVKVTRQ
ncbi:MAG: M36 family metallopeptidase [Blastocatellia bacterium]